MSNACLILTTLRDTSLNSLETNKSFDVTAVIYGEKLPADDFQLVYLRDPFNDPKLDKTKIQPAVEEARRIIKQAYFVDKVKDYQALLTEDKWHQYQLFSDLMPQTQLASPAEPGGKITKKRISARSRGIHFDGLPSDADHTDYIVQQRLDIKKEYRVYMVGEKNILPLAIRSSKTPDTRAKIIGLEAELPEEIKIICQTVHARLNYDFVGLDIAQAEDGYKLIEVNRSPQFEAYRRWSGINLAEELFSYLSSRLAKKPKK